MGSHSNAYTQWRGQNSYKPLPELANYDAPLSPRPLQWLDTY
jgi:hypothetical protein